MAEGDGTTTRVNLGMVKTKVLNTVDSHRSESLVDLIDVNVVLVKLELAQQLRDGGSRADTHNTRRYTGDGSAAELGEDRLV
jgi:hypothetical protein